MSQCLTCVAILTSPQHICHIMVAAQPDLSQQSHVTIFPMPRYHVVTPNTSQHPNWATQCSPCHDIRHVATRSCHVLSPISRHPPRPALPRPALYHGPLTLRKPPPRYRDTPPRYRDTHAQSRSHGPGAPTRKCPALVSRPPEVPRPFPAAPFPPAPPRSCLSAAHVTAGAASRRHRAARAREEEGGVTWAAAASRGGGRRARDAGRAHSAPFRRGQSERGGRGLERGRGLARGRGFSSHARCGPSWGGALGELGWGRE